MAGRTERTGITLVQLFEMFPDEDAARTWFEAAIWPDGRACGRCGSVRTREASHAKMPYWCTDCRSYFSVKIGTVMQSSKLSLRKWAIAIYLMTTNLKGVSSVKLGRDLGISQKSAWHMMHRIREAMRSDDPLFRGPVEADETFIGGIEANKHEWKRSHAGGGPVNMTAVVGIKDRETNQVSAMPVERTDSATLQGFVHTRTETTATVYTDEARAYGRSEAGARDRQSPCWRVREGTGPHERTGIVLGTHEAWLSGCVPLDEREAPAPLRCRV